MQEAETAFRRVVELAPNQAEGYAALAEIHLLPGRNAAEAVSLASKAVELSPSARHHYVLATAYWHAGDASAARDELERAIRLKPDEPEYRAALARLAQSPQP
jgi:Flp pilus assembly protein TadD